MSKQRLIDADDFLEVNKVYADCEFEHPIYQNTLREIIDEQPTIDAIPVSWLREKMDGYAAKLRSTELAALVTVMQMWEQEGR